MAKIYRCNYRYLYFLCFFFGDSFNLSHHSFWIYVDRDIISLKHLEKDCHVWNLSKSFWTFLIQIFFYFWGISKLIFLIIILPGVFLRKDVLCLLKSNLVYYTNISVFAIKVFYNVLNYTKLLLWTNFVFIRYLQSKLI